MEDYRIKLEASSSAVSLAKSSASTVNAMVTDSENTGGFLNRPGKYIFRFALALRMPSIYNTVLHLFCINYYTLLLATAAESRLKEAQLRSERLFDRLQPLKSLGENLSRNLSEIKEMINQARKQAASVSVAVTHCMIVVIINSLTTLKQLGL